MAVLLELPPLIQSLRSLIWKLAYLPFRLSLRQLEAPLLFYYFRSVCYIHYTISYYMVFLLNLSSFIVYFLLYVLYYILHCILLCCIPLKYIRSFCIVLLSIKSNFLQSNFNYFSFSYNLTCILAHFLVLQ